MQRDLTGKIAVVTGASRGIGAATARVLRDAGAQVVITGRNRETLGVSAGKIGKGCVPILCDHGRPESIEQMAQQVIDNLGVPDILVNNAGMMRSEPVVEMSLDLWNQVLAVNLTGVFLTTQAFLPGMIKKNRGDIIMISSMSGKKGDPGASVYNASKFAVQGFSQALQYEVRKHNIRVMVMNPSRVDKSTGEIPEHGAGLTLHADDLAETVLHLVSLPGRTLIRDMDIWGTNP